MVKSFEGNLIGKNKTFGIVVSRFNNFITVKLLKIDDGIPRGI